MPDPQNNAGEIERYANAFASALLLPAKPLLLSCDSKSSGGKLSFESIVSIAVEFGVSTDALLWRLVNLRRIRRESVESAISSRVLKAIERSSQPQSSYQTSALPDRYVRLAYQAFRLGKIGLAKLAEFLEQGMFELAAQQDLQPEMEHGEQAEIAVVGC
jgi:Zn-dependent peptidase ImmA (M78 family)